jgi:predicted porin
MAAAAVLIWAGAGGAYAADLDIVATKAPVATAPSGPASCTGPADFFMTACQLSWYGVRLYGTVDVGGAYMTHGSPFDKYFSNGASYFIQKASRQALWSLAPNGLTQSNIGVQIREPLGAGWSFVAQLEAGFNPYSLELTSSPASTKENIGIPVNQQTTNGDSSRAGQFYNGLGYFGFSSDTYGTLTFFRQNALTSDGVSAYDPMGAAYSVSPIGASGVVSGGGDTENAKYSSSVKYRVNIGDFRLGALYQFGGYELNNASKEAWGGQIGRDIKMGAYGVLSFDAMAGYNKDAVNLGLSGASTNAQGKPTGTMLPQVMTATLSNNTNVMLLAKYTVDRLKLYAGYEWMQFAPPSDPITVTGSGFTNIAGDFVCAGCQAINGTNINSTKYNNKDKILQVFWAGARYSVTDSVDLVTAYYHYDQNQYATGADLTSCLQNGAASKDTCHGTMDAVSALIDWKFAPKWDTYIGTFFSQMNGGLSNGFLSRNNLATTAGVRFRF